MERQISHFINGQIHKNPTANTGNVYNPVTGQIQAMVSFAGESEVNAAVLAAKNAFPIWSAWPVGKRASVLFNYRSLLDKHKDELAHLISIEHGKTLEDARGSLQRGMDVLDYACGIPNLLKGQFSENVGTGVDIYSMRQPLGVCVGITPFNFPAMVPLWMFPLAIACGNTFILKPSEKDPSCALKLVELMHEAGLPAGVLNCIQGNSETVNFLLTHQDVAAISFVGSTAVAKQIRETATAHGKRVQAFGGAKNHALVMSDADMDQVAEAIVGAAYGSAGERCMAISVVMAVGEDTADRLVEAILPRIKQIRIGNGLLRDIDMGPLVTAEHRERVRNYIAIGEAEGANLIVDGRDYVYPECEQGYFLAPCLFDNVTPEMRIYKEEIFGPVLSIMRFDGYETALKQVSAHPYGNGCAIFTRDGDTARDFASRVETGMVGINIPIPVPVAWYSFGGWKQSVFADLDLHGAEGVQFYTRLKTVTSRWPKGIRSGNAFTMPVH